MKKKEVQKYIEKLKTHIQKVYNLEIKYEIGRSGSFVLPCKDKNGNVERPYLKIGASSKNILRLATLAHELGHYINYVASDKFKRSCLSQAVENLDVG